VSFRADSVRGAQDGRPGTVDFRLARRHLIAEFKRGRLSRLDVCDAHPELIRAAENLGEPAEEPCPICESETLVNVSYVFGSRLPAYGRCISKKSELLRFAKQQGDFACYVVEVCAACRWNHLAKTYRLGRSAARSV
jgi:hypothetical protein